MNSKQIGKLIYNLDLGKFNNKTKLFESNNKDNWWRDEESFNTIKYHPLNSNTNNLLYKEYEQEYLYQNITNNEITSEIYNNNYILYYVTPLFNKEHFINTGLLYRKNNKIILYKNINNIKFNFNIKEWLILKINLKDKGSYKENDKSTMYRFFLKIQNHSMVYLHMKIQIHNVQNFIKKLNYKNKWLDSLFRLRI